VRIPTCDWCMLVSIPLHLSPSLLCVSVCVCVCGFALWSGTYACCLQHHFIYIYIYVYYALQRTWKPFNPILGETYEMVNHGGITFVAEQVSFWSVFIFCDDAFDRSRSFFFSPPSIQDYRLLDINWYFTVIILLVLHCLCCLVLISFTNCFSSQVSHHPPMSVGHVENEHFIYDISSKVKTKFFRELSRRLSSWKVNLFCYNCVQ